MQYLQATIQLRKNIEEINAYYLKHTDASVRNMHLFSSDNEELVLELTEFTNEKVQEALQAHPDKDFLVISDFVEMENKGQQLTYFLYKAYHRHLEKGLVFYQLIDKESRQPIQGVQFSNTEADIFYPLAENPVEESSCNAIETKDNTPAKPEIAFLIGHMDEARLLYDIERLIVETACNVAKHEKLNFRFILRISVFGAKPSADIEEKIEAIQKLTREGFTPLFPNAHFFFELEV